MKYLCLIWASMFRRRVRTIFTLLSIVAAFLLFGLLDSVRVTFAEAGQSVHGVDRLYTTPKVGGLHLPVSLDSAIRNLPGVNKTTFGSSLPATYQDSGNFVPIEAQADSVFELYPEVSIAETQLQRYQNTRTGALVRADFARKYRWKVGDKIPFETHIAQKDGSTTWAFDVVGIYDLPEPKDVMPPVLVHWTYLDEARASEKGTVGWYNATVIVPNQADSVAHAIDALSANSSHETLTQSENAFFSNLVRQFADIGLIVGAIMGAVFFTLVLLTGNTMAQAVRERVAEMAVLKTIGFTSREVLSLILSESVLLLLVGSSVGLILAEVSVVALRVVLNDILPMPVVTGDIWTRGIALAVVIGLAVGAMPARRGLRLRVVDALRGR